MIGAYFLKKVLDLIVLLLIHSTNTKNRKQAEKVLRSKIRLGCMPEQLMQNAFQDHSMVSAASAPGHVFSLIPQISCQMMILPWTALCMLTPEVSFGH